MADTFLANFADVDSVLLDGLGETVSVKDADGVSVGTVVGVLEKQYIESGDLQGFYPTFLYKESDLTINEGYEISYQSQLYNVRYPQPDGTGMSLLILGAK